MKRFYTYAFIISILTTALFGCSKDDIEKEPLLGSWNATQLVEDISYTDVENDDEIGFDPTTNPETKATEESLTHKIEYGTYIWTFREDKTVSVIGSDSGEINYNEDPNEFRHYMLDKEQNKIIFYFDDNAREPVSYDVLQLTFNEMILKVKIKWLEMGIGEVITYKTIYFNKINE